MIKSVWIAVAAFAFSTTCNADDVQTPDSHWSDCVFSPTATTAESCAAIIQTGQETGLTLAKAYFYRGHAYDLK